MSDENGSGELPLATKEDLADTGKFQWKRERLELPEIGSAIMLKTLSVEERDALPELSDADGNPDGSIPKLAAVFAAVVETPKLTKQEAEATLRKWPAEALDKVLVEFGKLAGGEEEAREAAGTFPADE
jgi:hypothetical protein